MYRLRQLRHRLPHEVPLHGASGGGEAAQGAPPAGGAGNLKTLTGGTPAEAPHEVQLDGESDHSIFRQAQMRITVFDARDLNQIYEFPAILDLRPMSTGFPVPCG